jgi:hypothetical protein
VSELESEILAPLTEGKVGEGIVEAVTEETMDTAIKITNVRKTKNKPKTL